MYPYKTVEKALARLHVVGPAGWGAFRGRIQHLQRLGMVPASPGRGKRIEYTLEDAAKWAFALELEEFGIDPAVVKRACDIVWEDIRFVLVEGWGDDDMFIVANPNFLNGDPFRTSPIGFSILTKTELTNQISFFGPVRVMVINLTSIRSSLLTSLEVSSRTDDVYPVDPASLEGQRSQA